MASPKSSVLKDVDLERPILKGYMYKQAHLHKSFNKRYFALYHNVLVYYNSEHEYRRDLERGTLEHRENGFRLEGMYLSHPEHKPHGARFSFILHCPDIHNSRKEVLLVTDSREERHEWMDKLQGQNPTLLPHDTNGGKSSGNSLEVPKARIRSNSTSSASGNYADDEPQNLDIRDGSSDTEN